MKRESGLVSDLIVQITMPICRNAPRFPDSERPWKLIQSECPVDHRFEAGRLDRPHEICCDGGCRRSDLAPPPDGREWLGVDLAGNSGQNADQRNMSTHLDGPHGLIERAAAANLDNT
jgi:hypothetical protein